MYYYSFIYVSLALAILIQIVTNRHYIFLCFVGPNVFNRRGVIICKDVKWGRRVRRPVLVIQAHVLLPWQEHENIPEHQLIGAL